MIKINLDETYEIVRVNNDFSEFMFQSTLKNKNTVELYVRFTLVEIPFLFNIYNLAFGPIDENRNIDDLVKLNHSNLNKVFSTIIFCAVTFLYEHKNVSVGIDGSNETRAYLYHRIFQSNKNELSDTVITIGIDWYVRLLRNNNICESRVKN